MNCNIFFVLLIFGNIPKSKTSNMEHDSAENPLVYSQDREIEFETTELRFSYQISLSTLNEIHNVYSIIHKLCGTTTFFKSFHDALFDDTDWKKLSNQNYPTKNLIHWQTDTINQLKVEWNTYVAKNGSTSKSAVFNRTANWNE